MANTLFDDALAAEGVTGRLASLARSIYQQESGGGKNTGTSNAGAHGGMQIIPGTFAGVADKGWDINNPLHNARAGIRYLGQLDKQSGGDSALTAVGYYGGPGGMAKARQGIAVSDPRNPNAPNTLQYGQQVVARMGNQAPSGRSSPAPAGRSAPVFAGAAVPEVVAQNSPPEQAAQAVHEQAAQEQVQAVQQANYEAAIQQYPEAEAPKQVAQTEVNPWNAFQQAMPVVNYAAMLGSYGSVAPPPQRRNTGWATGWKPVA